MPSMTSRLLRDLQGGRLGLGTRTGPHSASGRRSNGEPGPRLRHLRHKRSEAVASNRTRRGGRFPGRCPARAILRLRARLGRQARCSRRSRRRLGRRRGWRHPLPRVARSDRPTRSVGAAERTGSRRVGVWRAGHWRIAMPSRPRAQGEPCVHHDTRGRTSRLQRARTRVRSAFGGEGDPVLGSVPRRCLVVVRSRRAVPARAHYRPLRSESRPRARRARPPVHRLALPRPASLRLTPARVFADKARTLPRYERALAVGPCGCRFAHGDASDLWAVVFARNSG